MMLQKSLKESSEHPPVLKHAIDKMERKDRAYPEKGGRKSQYKLASDSELSGIARLTISDIENDQISSTIGLGGVREPLIRWTDDTDQKAPLPSIAQKFTEITELLNLKPIFPSTKSVSFASSFQEIFDSKFGGIDQLSNLHFSKDDNKRFALNVLKQAYQIVQSIMDIMAKRKKSMINAQVFDHDLNADRLVSIFRVLLTKRLNEVLIQETAFKHVKYGPPTPKDTKLSSNGFLDELNVELGKFVNPKSNNVNVFRKKESVEELPVGNPYLKFRKHSIITKNYVYAPENYKTTISQSLPMHSDSNGYKLSTTGDHQESEAINMLSFTAIPAKFNFEKDDDPILKAHSLYTRNEWIEPKMKRAVKGGKSRYLQRSQPVKVDFNAIFTKSDELCNSEDNVAFSDELKEMLEMRDVEALYFEINETR